MLYSYHISYITLTADKHQNSKPFEISRQLSSQLSEIIRRNLQYFSEFDNIIIYYDNGQYQITNILAVIFESLLKNHCEFRKVQPSQYKLFQTADLICTLTLIKSKLQQGKNLTKSEEMFFGSAGSLKKTFLKYIEKIQFKGK